MRAIYMKKVARFLCTKIRETAGGKKIREFALRGIQSSYTAHGETLPPATSLKMRAHEKNYNKWCIFYLDIKSAWKNA